MRQIRFAVFALPVLIAAVLAAPGAQAAPASFHHRTLVSVNANQSNNWSGYNQGTLEQGNKLFSAIAGDWTVPTATAHKAGEDEYSATWIGIGGGCIDAGCTVGDNTLIQTGTEQDIVGGKAQYSAWYELIPAPGITITGFAVKAGDKIHSEISEAATGSNVWTILLKNLTTGKSWSTTVPYSSSHATAEWIEETPLVFGSNGAGVGPLPKLSTVRFNNARTNKANAGLKASEEVQLVDLNNKVLATPSAPDPGKDGFNDCSYASSCAAPTTN